jgi:inner membrane protein
MDWWIWLIVGLALLGAELLTPGGFFVFFFGLAALAVGGLSSLGLGGQLWAQGLLFSVLSVGSIALFRHRLVRWLGAHPDRPVDSLVGAVGTMQESLAPDGVGKVELRGTAWTARNVGSRFLQPGERCRVTRVDGLTLMVRAESDTEEAS